MIDQLPTIEDLLAWACEKNQQQPIGIVAALCECPLAHYLNEHTVDATPSWEVGLDRITAPDRTEIFVTPDYLHHIIFLVDRCPDCEDGFIYPPQFIHILQTVQQSMKKGDS